MTGSDFCTVDANTVLYDWKFKQFADLEKYVDFCTDRKKWADKGAEQDRKEAERRNNAR